jgi:hypothetical protein
MPRAGAPGHLHFREPPGSLALTKSTWWTGDWLDLVTEDIRQSSREPFSKRAPRTSIGTDR